MYEKPLSDVTFFWQSGDRFAVWKGKWKLVVAGSGIKPELYDLKSDIEEKHNIAVDYTDIVRELVSALETWKAEVNKGVKKVS